MCVVQELKKRYVQQIDFSKGIGATGHSLGGAVAYYLCQHEEEFACGINIDGAVFGDYEGMIMKKPFLQICCKENYNTMTRSLIRTEAFVRCEVFEDMKHIGFSDAKFMIPIAAVVGKMDGVEMYKRLSACHFEMFDKYLK
jgi:dienelactone hydrolase